MARHRLDAIDRKILAELQDDGRMTNVELSRRAKITAPPCLAACAHWRRPDSFAGIMPISTPSRWDSS